MRRRMTITLDEDVYNGLYRRIGRRRMSKFIEELVRPYVGDSALEAGYQALAADERQEAEALEWGNALIGDVANETW